MDGMTDNPTEFWNGAGEFFSSSGFAWKFALVLVGVVVIIFIITILMKQIEREKK
jgi:ABC-type phosphate transport system permease subunit